MLFVKVKHMDSKSTAPCKNIMFIAWLCQGQLDLDFAFFLIKLSFLWGETISYSIKLTNIVTACLETDQGRGFSHQK